MTVASSPLSAPTSERGYVRPVTSIWPQILSEVETTPELRWPSSLAVYDQMRRQDAQVASVLRAVTLPVRRTDWRVHPEGARDEVTEFVAANLGLPIAGNYDAQPLTPRRRGRFSWENHLKDALLFLPYGHMIFEQVYRLDDGRAWLRKLGPRMPRTISEFRVARDGGLESVVQRTDSMSQREIVIPVDRLVVYVLDREGGDWTGTSLLRPAYKHWLLKDRLLRTAVATIDRNGMGIPLYQAAESEQSLEAGLKIAQEWRSGPASGAAIPYGASMSLVGVDGELPDAVPLIRYMDEQIARAVLAHFLNLGTQTGSWALGSTFADFFTMSLQTVADLIADTASLHIVEDLVDLNFGPDEPAPVVRCDEIGSRREMTAEALRVLTDSGVLRTDRDLEEFVRDAYGLPAKPPLTEEGAVT